MRGLVMTAHGGPGVLELRDDLEEPIPGEHDLLIEVHACGLNPVDTKIREGQLGERPLPHVLGFDVSGVVVATGGEVKGGSPGTRSTRRPAWRCAAPTPSWWSWTPVCARANPRASITSAPPRSRW